MGVIGSGARIREMGRYGDDRSLKFEVSRLGANGLACQKVEASHESKRLRLIQSSFNVTGDN